MSETKLDSQFEPNENKLPTWLLVVFFIVPLVGFIFYFVNRNTEPEKAKKAARTSLWGFGTGLILNILTIYFM